MPIHPLLRIRAALGQPGAELALGTHLQERGSTIAAARHFAAAAKAGLPEAQTRLGLCYLHGIGVPSNEPEARHWLERAAEAGHPQAQTELAVLTLRGSAQVDRRSPFGRAPARPDPTQAASLARCAADSGSAEAQALLAYILSLDPRLALAPEEADRLYSDSARAGWPLGQLGHAMALLRDGTPEAARRARDLLREAAAFGLPTAHFILGAIAESEAAGMPDRAAAIVHYRAGAEQGHAGAKIRLGIALMSDNETFEAETWLRRAAQDGDVTAAAMLGDLLASGKDQPANPEEAARWYRRAAEAGHAGSARALARAISSGAEGQPDPAEIARWLRTAIELGEKAAWADLGGLIASGHLPPLELPALHEWLQSRIRTGEAEAGYYVGICVNGGIGTRVDEKLARDYYLWAASLDSTEARVAAGEMLLNGRGGPADPDQARALFADAAAKDHAGAIYALGVMEHDDPERALTLFRRAAALGHPKARAMASEDAMAA